MPRRLRFIPAIATPAVLCLLAAVLGSGLQAAGLIFETPLISHEADFEETSFEAEFSFVVEGVDPVHINSLKSSCGCTVPSLPKNDYAPGETGIVHATFTYGSRTGLQRKAISVNTDQGIIELMLEVRIPGKWDSNTRSIFWGANEAREPKELVINFHFDPPVAFEGLSDTLGAFSVSSLEMRQDGKELALQFVPNGTEPTGIHRTEVIVKTAGGHEIRVPVYLRAL